MKKTPSVILSRPAVVTALAVAFALVAGTAILTTFATRGITLSSERATHAQQTLMLASQLLATVNEAETDQRSYLLTDDERYLSACRAAQTRAEREFATLRAQLSERPEHGPLFAQLHALLQVRFAAPALAALASDEGGRTVREIRTLLQTLQNQEIGELAEHSGAVARRAESFQKLGVGLLELAVALAGAGAWLLLRRVRHLEQFITVCAWTRRVRWQNRWISFEDYLAARFQVHCTHGICEEAAQRMKKEILDETPPAELRRRPPPGFTATASDT